MAEPRLRVINVGVARFVEAIREAGGEAIDVAWVPPAEGDREIGLALAQLMHPVVDRANQQAFRRYLSAQPILEGVAPARECIPWLEQRALLHAGPPIAWESMCNPMRAAIVGAILLEDWANDLHSASVLAASGSIAFDSAHHHAAVGPMAGVISPSMPLWVVLNAARGNRGYCNLNEGLGKVLRFGAHDAEVLARLRWMNEVLGPTLGGALTRLGGLELIPLMAQALQMGDELHNRNAAASSLLFKRLLPTLLETDSSTRSVARVAKFIAENDHFFLNLSMAACKTMLDAGHGVAGSSMVTAMARNGVEFGIRLSGTGDTWHLAPAPIIEGLFFPGHSAAAANPDLGDSSITETAGLGGFSMAAAPAIVKFVGGSPADAMAHTRRMEHITLGPSPAFVIPSLNFAGSPAGIDARQVVDTGIAPIINTGIAHQEAGIGQIGAGITYAPTQCFVASLRALHKSLLGAI